MEIKEKHLTLPEKIQRGHFLYFAYESLYTVYMDQKVAGCSLRGLMCNEGEGIYPVQSLSYRILRCLVKTLSIRPDDVFVDVGCGWGRMMGYLIEKGLCGKEMYGIEINHLAASFTRRIFRDNPKVHILCADAVKQYIPSATVMIMFNPFDEAVLESFLNVVEQHYNHSVRIYYLHAVHASVFNRRKDRWKLCKKKMLQPRHHIPVMLCEYELICRREEQNDEISEKS